MSKAQVWIIDDDNSIRWVLERALTQADFTVTSFDNAEKALIKLKQDPLPAAIVTDIHMPNMDGFTFLKNIEEKQIPVIIMTAFSDLETTVKAYKDGAFDYLSKPFDIDQAVSLIERACKVPTKAPENTEQPLQVRELLGDSPAMQEVFRAIGRLSKSHINVLITGESGTGKELVARALHQHSPRAQQAFIPINTAAIPKDLLESELFGHEKGAFTGAHSLRRGRFEQADSGSLFLDEIGDMPIELQTRLLRVLAEGEFYRVGGHQPLKANVRIIAATHQNLEERVQQGLFREDLYHRLNVIRIHLPALRQRKEDIPLLLQHFLVKAAKELQVESKHLRPEVETYLQSLNWPGNVRQLENLSRWLTVMASGNEIYLEDLPPELRNSSSKPTKIVSNCEWQQALYLWAEKKLALGEKKILTQAMPTFEKILIEAALEKTHGKKQEAAELLGVGRNTLTRKIQELQIG